MPARYLFRHSLCCLSSPAPVDLDILSGLRYPNTLKSEKELDAPAQLFKPLQGFGSDTCISIEEDGPLDCNFFYRDAPGVVNSSQQERRYFFTLPSILSIECANPGFGIEGMGLSGNGEIKLLPSEFWSLRRELAAWNEFPSKYSYVVLQTAMGLGRVKESEIMKWIISNSPSYGIIIDFPMTCHIFLLLKLCLRSTLREASGMYFRERDSVKERNESKTDMDPPIKSMDMLGNPRASHFDCPVLLESAVWLASQVSVLYGQLHGNSLVIGMLKHSFSCAGYALLSTATAEPAEIAKSVQDLTQISNVVDDDNVSEQHVNAPTVGEGTQISGSIVKEREDNVNLREHLRKDVIRPDCNLESEDRSGEKHEVGDRIIFEGKVFVSQVAAAVSALHERCLLEEKIKGLRHSGRLSKYQLLAEHDTAVRKAAEERGRRLDYKPILEHDGLVWQRPNYQDSKKHKTREEILAEERDYKRRRMSYRGKKVKRNPTQVLRDIIEGHMEEINLAGGIGCFVKGASETSLIATKPLPSDIVAETAQPLGSTNFSHSSRSERLYSSNNKEMPSDNVISSSKRHDDGNTDLRGINYCKSKSPQRSSQSFSDGNALNKYGHHQRHDHHHHDGKDRRDGAIFMYNHSQNDNERHYSGSLSANRFHELCESKRDSRSQDRKLGTSSHSHEGRHSSRSYERLEAGHRRRSHDDSHGRYRTGDSHDRYESGHSYVSYVNSPSSKEQNQRSKGDGWKDSKIGSTDNDMDNDSERKGSRSRSTAKHRDRDRCAEF